MRVLLSGGTVVNADGRAHTDVLTEDGKILALSCGISACDADVVIDARGCYLFPGFIDTHTHFDLGLGDMSTADDFPSGTLAALAGGTTTVLDFATQERGSSIQDALDLWHEKAQGSSCHYGFHMAVSEWNEERKAELPAMIRQGVTSFKMYMVYDNMVVPDDGIYDALKATHALGCLVGVHCENFGAIKARTRELLASGRTDPAAHALSRPNAVEAEGVARLMRLAQLAEAPAWVVHLSTAEGLEEAKRARSRGQQVILETCPQYLVLTDDVYAQADALKFIMSPPLRKEKDATALICALQAGELDVIGTDHCSFTMAQKTARGNAFSVVPNGGAGVQNRAELVYHACVATGHMTLEQMAGCLSANAARIFGMYPQKGRIAVGSDADIAVFDPHASHTISWKTNLHRCDNSPFEGMFVEGGVRDVLLGGVPAVCNGAVKVKGSGRYVSRGVGAFPCR